MDSAITSKLKEALRALDYFKEQAIKEAIAGYNEEYKKSKWYREPTLRDCVGDMINDDFTQFYTSVSNENADTKHVEELVGLFTDRAKEFGRSWWDEDLCCERTGYEYETQVYARFRNIAAEIIGLEPIDWRDYYEGRGV